MTSFNQSLTTWIIYRNETRSTNLLNARSNISEIRQTVKDLFRGLPDSYSLKVYDPRNAEMIDLNQHKLDYEYNPFRLYSFTNDVRLYVHTNRWTEFEDSTQTNILSHNTSQSTLLLRGPYCQQASSLHPIDTASSSIDPRANTSVNQEIDMLDSVLRANDFILNIDPLSNIAYEERPSNLVPSWSDVPFDESGAYQTFAETFNNQGQPVQNVSLDTPSDTWIILEEMFVSNEPPVQSEDTSSNNASFDISNGPSPTLVEPLDNQRQPLQMASTNNGDGTREALPEMFNSQRQSIPSSSASIINLTGNTGHPENNRLILSQNSNGRRVTTERNNTQKKELKRLDFLLDVKPRQKPIYKSDEFNKRNKNKTNGYITRIQGIKIGRKPNSSVLPIISIPKNYQNKPGVFLDVYAVCEQLQPGERCWIKHRDKGFLPSPITEDTLSVNPISFALNGTNVKNGVFKLKLPMTTMWDKSGGLDEVVYRLDEETAGSLHPAAYEPLTPRLLCVLREGDTPKWDTACLSDYIRSTKVNQ